MKNILLLSALFPPEPVVSASLSYDIARSLSERHNVTVISPSPSRPFGFEFTGATLSFGFKHIEANSFICPSSGIFGRFKESYSFGSYCYRYIIDNNQNIDVIYANTWPLLAQYFSVKAAKKYDIPIIVHVQDIYPESLSKKFAFVAFLLNEILRPLDKYILGKATNIIAISQKMKNYLVASRKLENDKIAVIPNWQDEEPFLHQQKFTSDISGRPFTFMYLGNIGPVAGIDLLLRAFAKTHCKNARLVIAGAGSMKENLVKAAEDFSNCIIEFWRVPEGKVPEMQNMSDVLILPVKKGAASTSVPSKLSAYMFSAKPIIACVDQDSDTAALINAADCGCVVEPENVELLTLAMEKFYNKEKSELEKLGTNGKKYAVSNLSKKGNLQKLVSLIENTIIWK